MRLGIVASRFNEDIAGELTSVPGALEIPLALQWLAQLRTFDALVAIGCVIRGETYHFEIVANESARGVTDVSLEFGVPIGNGILTTEDEAQAKARLDKGAEAVRVAIEMAQLRLKPRDA
jgi:6,7-dimethyl-8-ribityllumazine synthase